MDKIKHLYNKYLKEITSKTKEIITLVEGSGNENADVVIVLDNPTDEKNDLVVSPQNKKIIIDFLYESTYSLDDIYFTYAVKFCPYDVTKSGNIKYKKVGVKEAAYFNDFLEEEIDLISPKIIISIGELAFMTLTKNKLKANAYSFKMEGKHYSCLAYKSFESMKAEKYSVDMFVKKEDVNKERILTIKTDSKKTLKEYKSRSIDRSNLKNILVVYAGTNLSNDPTKSVVSRVADVFTELNINVIYLDIFSKDYSVDKLLDSAKDSLGLVIGAGIEWYGIGHQAQKLLDDIYFSGRADALKDINTMAIAISRNGYEDEGLQYLVKSLKLLGACVTTTLDGVIESASFFETNKTLINVVEKRSEDFFRTFKRPSLTLPSSIDKQKIYLKVETDESVREITNKEKKEVKKVSSYNEFIETQKKDIDELSEIFKEKANLRKKGNTYKEIFKSGFIGSDLIEKNTVCIEIEDNHKQSFNISIDKKNISTEAFNNIDCDVIIMVKEKIVEDIVTRKTTMQKAFLTGQLKVKGNFALLYKLDSAFDF